MEDTQDWIMKNRIINNIKKEKKKREKRPEDNG